LSFIDDRGMIAVMRGAFRSMCVARVWIACCIDFPVLTSKYYGVLLLGLPRSDAPLPFRLNDRNLRRLIRETADEAQRVFFTPHARQRMRERKIDSDQVLDCLRNGVVSESAHVNMHGNWQCTLCRRNAGDEISVAAALERAEDGTWIIVIAVF
jgi:hypothetical protein